jgi:hypothetical protein
MENFVPPVIWLILHFFMLPIYVLWHNLALTIHEMAWFFARHITEPSI